MRTNYNRKKTENKIKLLSDKPLTADLEQEVRFGHLDIVLTLSDILLNCPIPFTIGLFGKWGIGKTTILNLLVEKLNKEKIAVVNFDVWKHEGDALRRTFLKESTEQLKKFLPKNFTINERLETPIEKIVESKIGWKKVCVAIGFFIFLGIIIYYYHPCSFGSYISISFSGGILIWLFQNLLVKETLIKTLDRFKDPHEFELEFKKMVKDVDSERLLFIIDNLDRCTHNRAVELLSTVKTFLSCDKETGDENKCIFLIACDDEAIKAHLVSVYVPNKEKPFKPEESEEFLRKFFNTSIRIPQIIDTELQTYTENLLYKTAIPDKNNDIAYVITSAFRDNPRQIKQFINVLIVNLSLAKKREENGILTKGAITNNIPFLAKILVIQQKYPKDYKNITSDIIKSQELDNIFNDKVKVFLNETMPVQTNDIRPFISLRQSDYEQEIPELKDLEDALLYNNQEVVIKIIGKIKEKNEKLSILGIWIVNLIKRNKDRKIPLFNIIVGLLTAFRIHKIKTRQEFYNRLGYSLNYELNEKLFEIEPSLVFEQVLTGCTTQNRNGIINKYIDSLDKEGDEKEIEKAFTILKELQKHKNWLEKKQKEKIRTIITEHYSSVFQILSIFKSVEDQKDFISEETISKIINNLSVNDIENQQSFNDKIEQIISFRIIFTAKLIQELITKITELLNIENSKPFRPQKENFGLSIEKIVITFYKEIENVTGDFLNPFAKKIAQGINAIADISHKNIFVITCILIYDLLKDVATKSEVNNSIIIFLKSANLEELNFVFDKFTKETNTKIIKQYQATFKNRVNQDQIIFDLLYSIAPKEIRTEWLINLINSSPQRAIKKLQDINYKVDNKRKIIETLLAKVAGLGVKEKEPIYEAINKMKCADDQGLRNQFAIQIKSFLKNTDLNLQEIGYTTLHKASYLSAPIKREIVRETVEWLRSLQPANAGQPFSAKSILLYIDILNSFPSVKSDFIDFIFDKLIKRGVNINNIRLGIEILSEIEPKYENYSSLYDDVLVRVESEHNEEIKTEIKIGLIKLKPPRFNKKNRNFWKKIEKI